jgi:thiol-disulfide isomerase/thioredoxin
MPRSLVRGAVTASMLAFTLSACQQASEPAATAAAQLGGKSSAAGTAACQPKAKPANFDFTLKDLHGKEMHLSELKGKVVLLDFWATWCGPCKMEIPGFVELHDKYKGQGFEIVGLLTQDDVANAPAFMEKFKMNYQVLDANDQTALEDAYGPLFGLPTSFLISKDGLVCRTHIGFSPKEQFEKEIQALLAL